MRNNNTEQTLTATALHPPMHRRAHAHTSAAAVPEAYNEILSERVNFPLDREQTGREGAAESKQPVKGWGGEREIFLWLFKGEIWQIKKGGK